jgi:putative ABC transport system permease protein
MITAQLAVADLRSSWRVWCGLFAVCAVAAIAGSVPGTLVVGGLETPDVRGLAMLSIAGTTAAFALIAVLVVVSAIVRLTAALLDRTYGLWQLAGVTPRGVRWTMLLQTALVSTAGAVAGTAVAVGVVPPAVSAALLDSNGLADVRVAPSWGEAFVVVVVTAGAAILAGASGSRRAAATSPSTGLGAPTVSRRSAAVRATVAVLLVALAGSMLAGVPASIPDGAAPALLIGPVLVAAVAVLGRTVGTPAVRVWTAIVPTGASVAFGLAHAAVRWSSTRSDTTLAALLVAVGLPTALVGGQRTAASAIGADTPGGAGATVLVLSGPVLLAAIGAAATAAMAARDRARERDQLRAIGASPGLPVRVAALEGLVLGVTGTLVAAAVVAVAVTAEWAVLVGEYPGARPIFPMALLGAVAVFSTGLVVVSSVLPALPASRRRGPVQA